MSDQEKPAVRTSIIIAVLCLLLVLARNAWEVPMSVSYQMLAFMVLGGPLTIFWLASWVWRSVLRAETR